jgi:cytochrome c biogenesis protein CcdA
MSDTLAQLLLVLSPIALFDSTSITPLCIVPLMILLSGPQPLRRSFAFLGGIFITYVICSLLVLFGLQSVFSELNEFFSERLKNPQTIDLLLQIAIGLAMIFFGSRMADARESEDDRGLGEKFTALQAFTGGASLTLVGMPGAFPLFAAVDQILRAEPTTVEKVLAMLAYNVIFIAPLCGVVLLRIGLGEKGEPLVQRIRDFVSTWGHRLIVWGLIILGAVLVLDAIGWFFGKPLLPTW